MNIKINDRELIIKGKKILDEDKVYDIITEDSMGINKNEIHIKYLINEKRKTLKIFGGPFVKINNKKCYIIFNEKRQNLKAFLDLSEHRKYNKKANIIEIKLVGLKNLKRLDAMFYKCSSLLSISDLQKLNTRNIIDIKFMFHGCSLLKKLPDISNRKTNNVRYMSMMFVKCSSLIIINSIK